MKIIFDTLNEFGKLVDQAWKEGWIYYAIGGLIILFIMILFFT